MDGRLRVTLALVIAGALGAAPAHAGQDPAPASPAVRSPWLFVPIVTASPKLGTAGGGLAGYMHKFDDQSRVSIFGVAFLYTTTDSKVGFAIARTSSGHDHHRVIALAAFGIIKNDYDDYLGTGESLKTDDDLAGVAGRYVYRFRGNWFAGAQAAAANYQVFGESAFDDAVLETLGVRGFKSAGVGAVVMHDSRDNQDMPARGWFLNVNNLAYREALGGDESHDAYRLDVRAFVPHRSAHVLAFRENNVFTAGAPVAAQASVILRGYKLGQYLSQYMSSFEVEERLRFKKRFGATLFAGTAYLYGDAGAGASAQTWYPSYGAGLQFILKPEERMLINLEYAHGDADNYGLYLKLGYAW